MELNLKNLGREWLYFNKNSLKISTLQTYEYMLGKHIFRSELAYISLEEIKPEDIVNYSDINLGDTKLTSVSYA